MNRNPLLGSTNQKCCQSLTEIRVSKSYSVCKTRGIEVGPIEETVEGGTGSGVIEIEKESETESAR